MLGNENYLLPKIVSNELHICGGLWKVGHSIVQSLTSNELHICGRSLILISARNWNKNSSACVCHKKCCCLFSRARLAHSAENQRILIRHSLYSPLVTCLYNYQCRLPPPYKYPCNRWNWSKLTLLRSWIRNNVLAIGFNPIWSTGSILERLPKFHVTE